MAGKQLTGQYRWNIDTGESHIVGSKATETPNLERQGNLLDWAEDIKRLEEWKGGKSHDSNVLDVNNHLEQSILGRGG
jgi:hypothetical protein